MTTARDAWAALLGGLLGCAVQLQQAELLGSGGGPAAAMAWAAPAAVGTVAATLAFGLCRRWSGSEAEPRSSSWARTALLMLCATAAGWAWTEGRAALRLAERLPATLEGVDLRLEGVVVGLPVLRPDGLRFEFRVEAAEQAGRALRPGTDLPERVSLAWYAPPGEAPGSASHGGAAHGAAGAAAAPVDFAPGQRWRWTVRLRRPHGVLNPHGFDAELWLFERGLRASGSVRAGALPAPQRLAVGQGEAIARWRHGARAAMFERLGSGSAAGIVAGLAIGDQSALDRADWAVLRATGVAHLLAVSGLHITLLAALAAAALQALWRRAGALALRCPAPTVARWGGLAVAAFYAVLTGWAVPAQRTVWMLVVFTALRSDGRSWPMPAVLLVCAGVVVGADPWALLQPGFWLSFVAVSLLWGAGASAGEDLRVGHRDDPAVGPPRSPPVAVGRLARLRAGMVAALQTGWRSQWVSTVGLAPWTLLFFNQVSLVGLLANAVAVPLVTLLITPLALAGLLWAPAWDLAAVLADGLMALLQGLVGWGLASWPVAAAPPWLRGLGLVGAALCVLPLPGAVRLAGLALLAPMVWPLPDRPAPGEFDLLGVDIGQGNAVLVRTARHTLLYDTGPLLGRDSDAGERVLLPLLGALGERRLDLLVLSHRDADHTGGAAAVLKGVAVQRLSSSLEPGHPLRAMAPHQPCRAGQRWQWDGVTFSYLHPIEADAERAAQGRLRPNGLSCVLRIDTGRRAALLTGDIERPQELAILARHGLDPGHSPGQDGAPPDPALPLRLRADVLLVPHHGSRTSSTQNWLTAVRPTWALVQAGYRNRYGHPAADVMQRYAMHGIGVIRTDVCGAWHWHSASAAPWCERDRRRRYWHAPPEGDGPEFAKDEGSTQVTR